MKVTVTIALVCSAWALPAQQVLFQQVAPSGSRAGFGLRPAGDVDGDMVPDLAVPMPQAGAAPLVSRVEIRSGRNGAVLWAFGGFDQNGEGLPLDALGIGDVDGDQRSDIAVMTYRDLQVFSGRTGQRLYRRPPPVGDYTSVCELGDWNGDGRADLAVAIYNSGTALVHLLNGSNGAQLGVVSGIPHNRFEATVRSLGDLNGDGRHDLVLGLQSGAVVLATLPAAQLRTITPSWSADSRVIDGIDLDGDGLREIVIGRPGVPGVLGGSGSVDVYDALTGNQRLRVQFPGALAQEVGRCIGAIGDLDRDGIGDLAVGASTSTFGVVLACSGRSGALLWQLPGWLGYGNCGSALAAVGDLDGDGFTDVAVGCSAAFPAGGWLVVGGRVVADVTPLGGACGGGPFLPQLGATRPVLGQSVTVVLRDGTPGSNGVLALSARPPLPTYLGASTCTAHFELGNWVLLLGTPQPQWTLAVPVPNVPQLAGLDVALQSFYSPTTGPLGMDLSNGLAARLGY